ncbi:Nitric oxide synthase-interacting protein [Bagarius yarrelli]|uniref:Nitric oxide synthase-interacting protein n=1 Tax=Bagarius yarrelli TaxID=175774 RepID=A0A556V033_BAGYA|nr:Nitric oxide synthase-interacting protein [Bagarius yarrelli]
MSVLVVFVLVVRVGIVLVVFKVFVVVRVGIVLVVFKVFVVVVLVFKVVVRVRIVLLVVMSVLVVFVLVVRVGIVLVVFKVFVVVVLAYEKQKKALRSEGQLESGSEEREKIEKFRSKESSIVSKPINPFITGQSKVVVPAGSSPSGSVMSLSSSSSASASTDSTSSSSLPSFWIPSLTPEAKPTLLKKPDRYVCAVTKDTLGNSVPSAVLRPS